MTEVKPKSKWRRWAMLAGVVLALVCQSIPEEYRVICVALAQVCTGGL